MKRLGFIQTASDPCIYYQKTDSNIVYIGVYVDDIILAGKDEKWLQEIKDDFWKKFDIKDLGEVKYFLGIKVVQDKGHMDLTTCLYQEPLEEL